MSTLKSLAEDVNVKSPVGVWDLRVGLDTDRYIADI